MKDTFLWFLIDYLMQQTSKIGDVIQKNGEKSSLHNKIL
jgi:hypothetical protein